MDTIRRRGLGIKGTYGSLIGKPTVIQPFRLTLYDPFPYSIGLLINNL
jgi:hypothetical protein